VGGPAPAALLVLLLLLPKVLRANCSPEPTVAAGEPSTAMSLLMLLAVVDGRADNSTSLPALRPVLLCLPGPLGGLDPSPGVLFCALFGPDVSDSPPHERQRRAFCMTVRCMLLVQAEVMEAVLLLFLQHINAACRANRQHKETRRLTETFTPLLV
jgi:hypothetical protein